MSRGNTRADKKYSSAKPHPVDIYVGSRVKQRREQCGMSSKDLARTIRRTYQQLLKYETGVNRISAGVLYDLSRALHVDPGYFFDGYSPDGSPPSNPPDYLPVSPTWLRLYHDLYHSLKPDARQAVITMIQLLMRQENPEDT